VLHAESVVESAMTMSEELEQNATASAVQTNKDDIARLLHLYKEPIAQRHWTDLYSILSRPELDARKSGGECGTRKACFVIPSNGIACCVIVVDCH
jgi:hypothetical protein